MAVFESKASRSNFNLISPERIADGARKLAPFFFAERSRESEPRLIGSDLWVLDFDRHPGVIGDSAQRLSELEDVLACDVFGFDRSTHAVRITVLVEELFLRVRSCGRGRGCSGSSARYSQI
jgi:hypothetical protein